MPDGYRVTLGNGSLDSGDAIGGPLVTFTTTSTLGAGSWTWSGTWNGQTFVNTFEPGVYFLGSDGFVYFVPDFGPVTTITTASATSAPSYTQPDGIVTGSDGAELIDSSFTDDDGDRPGAGPIGSTPVPAMTPCCPAQAMTPSRVAAAMTASTGARATT
ncbi:MAG: hypothetical protein V2I53_03400 [Paracoccaceae bacterium]|jgi:hypothetical protein|nr:hypothetical protein [Paracoccaceae bacterium]